MDKSRPPWGLAQKVGAEMTGTFALVFAGCGAIMVNDTSVGATVYRLVRCGGEERHRGRGCC